MIAFKVQHLQAGDTFVGPDGTDVWTAVDAPFVMDGNIVIRVQFVADGGIAARQFVPGHTLTVRRAA